MVNQQNIEEILKAQGYNDYKWCSGANIQVCQWVRFKCMFGCDGYGKVGSCPPAVPSIAECRDLFSEYQHILVIHLTAQFEKPEMRGNWSRRQNTKLLSLEKAVFLAGCQKAFLLFMDHCRLCEDCPGQRAGCKHPDMSRPSPEGLGMDVYSTVRALGFPINVLTRYDQEMNRYAFLLVE